MPKKTYIMYSSATNVTGEKLQEELGIDGGTNLPKEKYDILIGWGVKTKGALGTKVGGAKCTIINHPDLIRSNRNKFAILSVLRNAGVNVKDTASSDDILAVIANENNPIQLPVIGRRNFHQGGRNFWTCLTKTQVDAAIKCENGAQYFQSVIDIQDEYRLHIMNGELIYAQRKVKRNGAKANMDAFVDQHKEKLSAMAEKQDVVMDDNTVNYVLEKMSKTHQHPDMIVRSNFRGWKFSHVADKNVKKELLEEAKKALKAVGLEFGAVDCAIDADGKAWIIEVNSGPGLEASSLKQYVDAFRKIIDGKDKTKKSAKGSKEALKAKLELFKDLVDVVDDDKDADVLAKLWDKLG